MARHRTTFFVHDVADVEQTIEQVNADELTLQLHLSTREDRYVLLHPGFNHIKALRIHVITKPTDGSIFNYHYEPGTSIYFQPDELTGAHSQQFFDEANLLAAHLGVQVDKSWILSTNSFYFYQPEIDVQKTTDFFSSLVSGFPESWSNLDVYIADGQLTVKVLSDVSGKVHFSKTPGETQEIGVFGVEPGISTHDDFALAGFRVVFNDDDDEKNVHKTLFHVKPRHRQLSSGQHFVTVEPNGLHPFLKSKLNNIPEMADDDDVQRCVLYGYLNLQKSLFLDKNNLSPGMAVALNFGNSNLELPEYEIREWGNEILFKLYDRTGATLNLHSRYQLPAYKTKTSVSVNAPQIFLACDVSDASLLESSSFDNRLPLGGNYERFFSHDTVFYHIPMDKTTVEVEIPNANLTNMYAVMIGTLVALLIGLAWVLKKLIASAGSVVDPQRKDE